MTDLREQVARAMAEAEEPWLDMSVVVPEGENATRYYWGQMAAAALDVVRAAVEAERLPRREAEDIRVTVGRLAWNNALDAVLARLS